MRGLIQDFKGFALSGNVMDLAIGVIIGAAFSGVVESFSKDILMALIAALGGNPNFDDLAFSVNGTEVFYGKFITVLVNFVIIAASLLFMVKLLMRIGLNFRAQGNRECDFCKSFVPVDASRCMYCTSEIVPLVAD